MPRNIMKKREYARKMRAAKKDAPKPGQKRRYIKRKSGKDRPNYNKFRTGVAYTIWMPLEYRMALTRAAEVTGRDCRAELLTALVSHVHSLGLPLNIVEETPSRVDHSFLPPERQYNS